MEYYSTVRKDESYFLLQCDWSTGYPVKVKPDKRKRTNAKGSHLCATYKATKQGNRQY